MKKTYNCPQTLVTKIAVHHFICNSPAGINVYSDSSASSEYEVLSREGDSSLWDDEE